MIAHIDADSFFASVLQRLHPRLRGKPLFALGMGGTFIIAASYEAKAKGVKTGMRLSDARKLCPDAAEMPSDFRETALASEQIEEVIQHACPVIEQMSIDEWYLDLKTCVGGTPTDLLQWGKEIQKEILRRVGLSVSVGIAPTKLLSKLAGETKKPAGVTVVHPEEIEEFLKTRPIEAVCGIGRKRAIPARAHGWNTAWDMVAAPKELVQRLFGKSGVEMQHELSGIVEYAVCGEEEAPKSVSRCRSFPGTMKREFLWSHVLHHLSRIVLRMRDWNLAATHITVWLRTADYGVHGTAMRLPTACDEEGMFLETLRRCFRDIYKPSTRYNQAGLAISGLVPAHAKQHSLFEEAERSEKDVSLQDALDKVRKRFGRETITRAAALSTQEPERPELAIPIMDME